MKKYSLIYKLVPPVLIIPLLLCGSALTDDSIADFIREVQKSLTDHSPPWFVGEWAFLTCKDDLSDEPKMKGYIFFWPPDDFAKDSRGASGGGIYRYSANRWDIDAGKTRHFQYKLELAPEKNRMYLYISSNQPFCTSRRVDLDKNPQLSAYLEAIKKNCNVAWLSKRILEKRGQVNIPHDDAGHIYEIFGIDVNDLPPAKEWQDGSGISSREVKCKVYPPIDEKINTRNRKKLWALIMPKEIVSMKGSTGDYYIITSGRSRPSILKEEGLRIVYLKKLPGMREWYEFYQPTKKKQMNNIWP